MARRTIVGLNDPSVDLHRQTPRRTHRQPLTPTPWRRCRAPPGRGPCTVHVTYASGVGRASSSAPKRCFNRRQGQQTVSCRLLEAGPRRRADHRRPPNPRLTPAAEDAHTAPRPRADLAPGKSERASTFRMGKALRVRRKQRRPDFPAHHTPRYSNVTESPYLPRVDAVRRPAGTCRDTGGKRHTHEARLRWRGVSYGRTPLVNRSPLATESEIPHLQPMSGPRAGMEKPCPEADRARRRTRCRSPCASGPELSSRPSPASRGQSLSQRRLGGPWARGGWR